MQQTPLACGGRDSGAAQQIFAHRQMDTLGFEPRAFRMRSGCDTTTPCALEHRFISEISIDVCWTDPMQHSRLFRLQKYAGKKPHFGKGLLRELNPGPLAPEARIIPLDQAANEGDSLFCMLDCQPQFQGKHIRVIAILLAGRHTWETFTVAKKFRHRDSNPGRSGESRVS